MSCVLPLVSHILPSKSQRVRSSAILCASDSFGSSKMAERNTKLMEFPHLSTSHRELMVNLVSAVESRFASHLLPSSVPEDVQYYQNQSGTSQGTLHIRSGTESSPIDFILASWLHLEQPAGGALNITNIAGYVKSTTDVPHFQFELVQCSPTFLIFFLDLIPRRDIVLHPDYLQAFYEQTKLENHRQLLAQVPEVQPYFSSSLYFRKVISPTGILVSVKSEEAGARRVEEIISELISPVSLEVLRVWMEQCDRGGREVDEKEKDVLEKRDLLIKRKAIEMDLGSSMPLQFGEEIANRVLKVITGAFKTY